MKPFCPFLFVAVALLQPLAVMAAKDGKARKRPAAAPAATLPESAQAYDKNRNQKIDSDELAAMQQAFAELRKLDKNGNGEIETAEVTPPKPATSESKSARALSGLKKVDKNGNGKIDGDEIESLQKVFAGGRIMERLDQNGNGKLEPNEVERLNQHFQQAGGGSLGSASATRPAAAQPPANTKGAEERKSQDKKSEAKKQEEKKPEQPKKEGDKFDSTKDPFLPGTASKS